MRGVGVIILTTFQMTIHMVIIVGCGNGVLLFTIFQYPLISILKRSLLSDYFRVIIRA